MNFYFFILKLQLTSAALCDFNSFLEGIVPISSNKLKSLKICGQKHAQE